MPNEFTHIHVDENVRLRGRMLPDGRFLVTAADTRRNTFENLDGDEMLKIVVGDRLPATFVRRLTDLERCAF